MGFRALRVCLPGVIAIVCLFGVAAAVGAAAVVKVGSAENGMLGTKILVSASGRTLYHDSAEGKNAVTCTGSCAREWPPLLIRADMKASAGPGVAASLLGTVKRPDGTVQVTYHGMPLYLYSGDSNAGEVNGQGLYGIWHAIAPSGSIVTKSATTSSGKASGSGSTSTSSTGSSSSSSSGYGAGTTTNDPCSVDPNSQACYDVGM
jgi:predicted lipoprotein with Yx(FWY)xxD motif